MTRQYSREQLSRMLLYHYESALAGEQIRRCGYLVAVKDKAFDLMKGGSDLSQSA